MMTRHWKALYLVCLQNHAFIKKTEQEYEKEINFGTWVCNIMDIKPPADDGTL